MTMKKLICKIFGHKWQYTPLAVKDVLVRKTGPLVNCKRCGFIARNQWEIYQKYFLGKPEGRYIK